MDGGRWTGRRVVKRGVGERPTDVTDAHLARSGLLLAASLSTLPAPCDTLALQEEMGAVGAARTPPPPGMGAPPTPPLDLDLDTSELLDFIKEMPDVRPPGGAAAGGRGGAGMFKSRSMGNLMDLSGGAWWGVLWGRLCGGACVGLAWVCACRLGGSDLGCVRHCPPPRPCEHSLPWQ